MKDLILILCKRKNLIPLVSSVEPRSFERADGSSMNVFTLSAGKFLLEKLAAYKNWRLARDIYNVFMLSSVVSNYAKLSDCFE